MGDTYNFPSLISASGGGCGDHDFEIRMSLDKAFNYWAGGNDFTDTYGMKPDSAMKAYFLIA